ncbi:hypothetical protein AVEN_178115-1 [Araneus ventricosus]|uniref:Uncharacterized protein n=1 Tax=Araneus ventricosus TaxID=182803 RepID=A0A4Y2M8K8_ARAVE|nr:hypothetical protein AVEN_178115-1 [Araneus ventricosus]
MIENDSLRHLSQKAKEALQEIDKVVKTFQKHYRVLSEEFSRQFEFLMTLNDKSLSWNDSCTSRSGEKQHDYAKSETNPNHYAKSETNPNQQLTT